MAENSKIEWTDHTFNPWRGCTKVHTGCKNCYAESLSGRNPGTLGTWGPNGTRVRASDAMWREPLKWNEQAAKAGVRARVFCASLADVFEDWQDVIHDHAGSIIGKCPACKHREPMRAHCSKCGAQQGELYLDDLRGDLFALIDQTPNLDWLLLTKRPENIRKMWASVGWGGYNVANPTASVPDRGRSNVWLGTSVSDQATADKYAHELLKCRDLSPVLFLSVEPLLGPVKLIDHSPAIDWVIVGGESGHHARPCCLEHVDDIRLQCEAAESGLSNFNLPCVGVTRGGEGTKGASHESNNHLPAVRAYNLPSRR